MGQYESKLCIKKKELILEILTTFYNNSETDYHNFCEIQIAERPTRVHYGNRHLCLSETDLLQVYDCKKEEDAMSLKYELFLKNELIDTLIVYVLDKKTKMRKIRTEVKNISDKAYHLDYVSSFVHMGFWKNSFDKIQFYLSSNGWYTEAQWSKIPLKDLGVYNGNNVKSMKNFTISNTGTWSTKSHLPVGILENEKTQEFLLWNIESNNCWNVELGEIFEGVSLCLSGANNEDNGWTKELLPNEKYVADEVSYTFGKSLEEVLDSLTEYRRIIKKRKNKITSTVFFNEYMWLSSISPNENNSIKYGTELKEFGADYYIIDCGWHDEPEDPFYSVGKWEESTTRFPNGLKNTLDKLRDMGYKIGLWIEPEVVGVEGDAYLQYDEDCYFQRYGKPVVYSNRYQLDFRNAKVTKKLDKRLSDKELENET